MKLASVLRSVLNCLAQVFFVLACAASGGCRGEEKFPHRPILLICPWSAGGGSDRVARQFAVQLEGELGVPVNVVNATGGGGVTGHTRGALARPDGYTLTLITPELNMLHWRGLTSIDRDDFSPLVLVNRDEAALFVRQSAPWQTLDELTAEVRRRPGALKASGTAFGGIWHIGLAGWLTAAGCRGDDVVWISINGAGPSLQELIAGGVDLVCCSVPEAATLLAAGEVRCLGVMADRRLAVLPEVPTLKEQGYDWSLVGWRGLALPLGVPPEREALLNAATRRVAESEQYREFLARAGFGGAAVAGPEFVRDLEQDDAKYQRIFASETFHSIRRQRFGPMFFPTIIGALLVVIGATLAMGGHLSEHVQAQAFSRGGLFRVIAATMFVVLYALLAERVGFVLTAGGLLFSLLWMLKVRWPVAAVVTLVLAPALYQIFAVWLRVPLPWGILGW